MDYSKLTLGELLSSENNIIRKHATGILKVYQNDNWTCLECGQPKKEYEAGYCEKCFDKQDDEKYRHEKQ